jgi:hypothetical protein
MQEIACASEEDRPSKKAIGPAGVAGAWASSAHGRARLAHTVTPCVGKLTSFARASSTLAHERSSFAIAPAIGEDASAM